MLFRSVHHHILPDFFWRETNDAHNPVGGIAPPPWDAGMMVSFMDEAGIDVAVTSISTPGVHVGDDARARSLARRCNDLSAKLVQARPSRLGGFAALPLPDVDGALDEMSYALDTLAADGVVLLSHQNGVYVGDPRCEPLYAEMDRRGAVCFVHPTIPPYLPDGLNLKLWPAYLEYAFDTTRVAANLIYHEYMRRYPAIRWLLAHAGGAFPYLSMRLRLMEELETKGRKPPFPSVGTGRPFDERVPEGITPYLDKFWYDVALSGAEAPMAALTALAPASRILYGSDWPFVERAFVVGRVQPESRVGQRPAQ